MIVTCGNPGYISREVEVVDFTVVTHPFFSPDNPSAVPHVEDEYVLRLRFEGNKILILHCGNEIVIEDRNLTNGIDTDLVEGSFLKAYTISTAAGPPPMTVILGSFSCRS
jgi:hypothetical protein